MSKRTEESTDASSSSSSKTNVKSVRENTSLHAMNVHWLRMVQETKSGKHSIQGWAVDHVRLLGKIIKIDRSMESHASSPYTLYTLLDSRGPETIPMAVFLNEYKDSHKILSQLAENTYVICVGKLSKVDSEKVIVPKRIFLVKDLNMVTVHELEVEQCIKVRESSMSSSSLFKYAQPTPLAQKMNDFGGVDVDVTATTTTTTTTTARAMPKGSFGSVRKTIEGDIKKVLMNEEVQKEGTGLSTQQIIDLLAEYTSEEVKTKLQAMRASDNIYNTIDDDHYLYAE